MSSLIVLSWKLACKDWFHEASLSFCGVLALASMLLPLLVLHGVHNGVVEHLRESLLRDPAVLVLIPSAGKGAGFDETFIERIKAAPGLRFGIGRPRDVASELQMMTPNHQFAVITLEATAPGDPLLTDHGMPQPHSSPDKLELVLSHTAAQRLETKTGETVSARIARRLSSGKFKRLELTLLVKDVLPPIAGSRDTGFVDLPTLNAIQDFRDGIDSPLLQTDGELPPPAKRHFESFRAYAASLDDVPILEKWFKDQGITVKTRARDIAAIKKIDSALGSVIGLIAATGCTGFFAFMASSTRAAVRRKWKQMGMLKLIGFHNLSILFYPVAQALFTGVLGYLLAFSLYGGVSWAIDFLFAEEVGGGAVCKISAVFFCITFICVQILAILASLRTAFKAASISPSTVIHES